MEQTQTNNSQQNRGRWKLLAVLAVCAAPLIFSYLTYFVIKPSGRTNYGDLIDPRAHPIPALGATTLDGKPTELDAYKGKWIMLKVGPSACAKDCMDQMFAIRQVRSMQGKDMERIERVWLVTDAEPMETMLIRELDGVRMLRAPREAVAKWLPLEKGASLDDSIFLIDPLGNLMMRFPPAPAGSTEAQKVQHYAKVKKDIARLLKASAIG
ncbi:cytochrome C oxidase subunit I [Massilia sp. R2A-15]|uniref:SCO family protein n=1 Tax=Massilia sp. R2A-15 TaxID=3064278 RepID=UPI002736C8CF|nr:cytochrome C oxidase subunit I [Massilia sp. R2A-15]WLI89812.1 cytochrome C oxidase subunit I [Massilia sp. R2A-15]